MSNVVSSIEPFMAKKAHEVVDKILESNKSNFDSGYYGRLIYEFTDSYFSTLRSNPVHFVPMTSAGYVVPADEDDQNPPIHFGFTMNLDAISVVSEEQRFEKVDMPKSVDVLTVVNEAIDPDRCNTMYNESLQRGRAANVMVFAEAMVRAVGGTIKNGAMIGVPAVLGAVISTAGTCLPENGSSMAPTMPKLQDGKLSWFFLYTDRMITVTFHFDTYTKAMKDFVLRYQEEHKQFPDQEQAFVRILTVDA